MGHMPHFLLWRLKMNYNELQKLSLNELKTILNKNVKIANTRLKALEDKNHVGVNSYRWVSENVNKDYSLKYNKHGNPRFTQSTKGLSKNEILHKLSITNRFLESKTSTLTGIKKAYQQSYKTFKEKYNIKNMTFNDYVSIFETDNFEHFKKNYYSVFSQMFIDKPDNSKVDGIKKIIENSYGKTLQEIDNQYNQEYGKSLIFDD